MCSTAADQNTIAGKNVGDLLNAQGVTWGWFQGGFDLTVTNPNGTTGLQPRSTPATVPAPRATSTDYIPHHAPFQYYASTANPTHARPSRVAAIGHTYETDGTTTEPANHQYDSHDFFDALQAGNFPAVELPQGARLSGRARGLLRTRSTSRTSSTSVVTRRAGRAASGSSTADRLRVRRLRRLVRPPGAADREPVDERAPTRSTARASATSGAQQNGAAPTTPLLGNAGGRRSARPAQGRCGYGTRIPLLVVSPFAKKNYIDHTLTDQSSVLQVRRGQLARRRSASRPGGSFDTIAGTIENMLTGI